ncbi:SpvB/TcaC N-terminal domain-containing protein [Haladaptatus sp. W1]|uniref:SpvB/TcaC N-terminal domain-containing protein n=1 Tax=Haladaptatus sp. W1 TaxID=1897478 RepID=UPI0009F5B030|nr:SpvB/TcaC N-terminal domain-containing protein [Haladaptatus sp. W1]
MSNKSGVADQVISLPEGGGALSGIGEKFSPDLFTGTGNFTVPIDLPAGRNGFQPELSLSYSTGNGNGPFGLGQALSVPGVSRKTSDGIPVYNGDDVFVLSGAEDLVPISETGNRTRYRPRTEGLFARIHRELDAVSDHWEVKSKDGLTSIYGTPNERGNDPAVVADSSNRNKVFSWKLTETTDPFENRIQYEYERDMGDDGRPGQPAQHQWDQLYLKTIKYVDFEESGDTKYLVSVRFEYEDRPDPFSVLPERRFVSCAESRMTRVNAGVVAE